ncbi:biotin--[acetyl-CoA-carboxylase] ligase [Robiginitalea sp. IMCC43444]|uniref:biotin--[acetyl-CoA-carboxylase] ligase n=1 Tax=Robiginitalea sp. IMCC43444 TaxID=3459121 RepID=UPI004042EE02
MHVIKLSATDSTNDYLKNLQSGTALPDFSVVIAEQQRAGRGQRGNMWFSEKGKNLTFSILKKDIRLSGQQHFYLNTWVSLALLKVLEKLEIPQLRVKWPNDIMSGALKICGILIENVWQGSQIDHSVIGIGLNVNQLAFTGLPGAGSMALATGKQFDLNEVLMLVLEQLRSDFKTGGTQFYTMALRDYEQNLYYRNFPANFKTEDGKIFTGNIKGVTTDGKLHVEGEDGKQYAYGFKEVQLLHQ